MCVPQNNQQMGIAPKGLSVENTPAPSNVMSYGKRPDGTMKGTGYLGELKRPDGGVSTEITVGVNLKGKDTDIPLITPYSTKQDLDYLLKAEIDPKKNPKFFDKMPKGLMDRAIKHAQDRQSQGLPIYAD